MRRLNSLINSNPELKSFAAKAENLLRLQKKWAALMPPPFSSLCRPGPISMGQMTVYTSNNAIAAKLKMLIPSLLKKLQNDGVEVTAIRVQVQVESKPRAPIVHRRDISETARRQLAELAEKLPDSQLKSSLDALVKHQEK
jgi:hypothetical protein